MLQRPHRLHSFRSDNSLGEAPSRGLPDAAQSGPEVRQRDGHTGSERSRTGQQLAFEYIYEAGHREKDGV